MRPTDYLNQTVLAKIDRPLGSRHPGHGFLYMLNYGYIPSKLAPDGEGLDAYVLGIFEPIVDFERTCITVLQRLDDQDDKLVLVPKGKIYSDEQILALTDFQERFFKTVVIRRLSVTK